MGGVGITLLRGGDSITLLRGGDGITLRGGDGITGGWRCDGEIRCEETGGEGDPIGKKV
jgi:hypothetical protein